MARPATIFPVSTGRDENGQFQLAGCSVSGLAVQHGTPLYIYDGATVREHVNTLKRLLELNYPALSEIAYAAKAYFSLGFARKAGRDGSRGGCGRPGRIARGGQGRIQTRKNPSARE